MQFFPRHPSRCHGANRDASWDGVRAFSCPFCCVRMRIPTDYSLPQCDFFQPFLNKFAGVSLRRAAAERRGEGWSVSDACRCTHQKVSSSRQFPRCPSPCPLPVLADGHHGEREMKLVLNSQRPAYFPVMSEGIDDAPKPPAVLFRNRANFFGTRLNSLCEHGIGIRHSQKHFN